jgi:hypothetical protein
MMLLEAEEALIECTTFIFKHAYKNLNASVLHHMHATPSHEGIGVEGADDHAANTGADDELGTRWSLAIVAARFETDIEGGILIINALGMGLLCAAEAVGFGMRTTILLVPALGEDAAGGVADQDGAHHRVGCDIVLAQASELEATSDIGSISHSRERRGD